MRDAIGILEQAAAHARKLSAVDVRAVWAWLRLRPFFLGEAVAGRDLAAAFRLVKAVEEAGKDPALFARQAAEFFRDLLVLQLPGEQAPVGLEPEATGRARELAGQIEAALLKKGVECFLEAGVAIRRGTEGALSLEMALVRLILEEPGVEGVSERLAALEERLVRLEKAVQAYPGARTVSRRIESDGKGVPEARSSSTQAPAARTPETRAAKTRTERRIHKRLLYLCQGRRALRKKTIISPARQWISLVGQAS